MRPSMDFSEPLPSTIVVVSLSTVTRFARPKFLQPDAFQLEASLFHDRLAASQDTDILQHRLATVTKAWSLHRASVQCAAQLIDNQGGQRFAFHVLRDDQQRLAGARDLLQRGSTSFMLLIFFS